MLSSRIGPLKVMLAALALAAIAPGPSALGAEPRAGSPPDLTVRDLSAPSATVVFGMALNSDGDRLAVAYDQGGAIVWDLASGKPIARRPSTEPVFAIAFCGSAQVASASMERTVLWDVGSRATRARLDDPGAASLACSRDGTLLASGAERGGITLWSVGGPRARPRPLAGLRGKKAGRHFSFGPDGKTLASTALDKVLIHDVASGQLLASLDATANLSSVACDPAGRLVAAGGQGRVIDLWDTTDAAHFTRRARPLDNHSVLMALAFSPKGEVLASGGDDEKVRLWAMPEGELLSTLEVDSEPRELAFTPDGKTLAVGLGSGTVRLLTLAAGANWRGHAAAAPPPAAPPRTAAPTKPTLPRVTAELFAERRLAWPIDFSHDGKLLSSVYDDGTIIVWDLTTRAETARTASHAPFAASFVSHDRLIAIGSFGDSVDLWDFALPGTTTLKRLGLSKLAVSPDGATLALGDEEGGITLRSADPPYAARRLAHQKGRVGFLAFAPDGLTLASAAYDGLVSIFDTSRGKLIASFQAEGKVSSIAFAPDGHAIATTGRGPTVGVFSTTDGKRWKRTHALPLHGQLAWDVAFSPDGEALASADDDGVVRFYSMPDGEQVYQARVGRARSLAFGPDGRTLAVGMWSGKILILTLPARARWDGSDASD